MDLFGGVPLIEKSNPEVEDIVQEKRSKVFNFIVKELAESSSLLSKERSNQPGVYYGRMTQPVVWFLLAKLALNAEVIPMMTGQTEAVRTGIHLFRSGGAAFECLANGELLL